MEANKYMYRNIRLEFWIAVSFLYTVLKMYRNSIDGSSDSTGGIWNVINVAFVACAFLLIIVYASQYRRIPIVINSAFLYSFAAATVSLVSPRPLSISILFSYLMLFYFASVAFVFYNSSIQGVGYYEYKLYNVLYYILAIFSLYLMVSKNIGIRRQVYVSDAYFLLCTLPLAMYFDEGKRLIRKIAVLAVVLIFAAKRTGFLALAGALLVYYYIEAKQGKTLRGYFKMASRLIVISVAFFVVYGWLSQKYNINLLNRMQTIATDGGSGRDDIYRGVWDAIRSSNPLEWIFGHGLSGVQYVYGRKSGAHNDFLEIIYNYGWIVFSLFVWLQVKMIWCFLKMVAYEYPKAKSVGAAIVISILMSLFSNYFITFTHITMMAAFWGLIISDWYSYLDELDWE